MPLTSPLYFEAHPITQFLIPGRRPPYPLSQSSNDLPFVIHQTRQAGVKEEIVTRRGRHTSMLRSIYRLHVRKVA